MASARDGKVITFYSYKGGTGRSMALAHAAWLLAAQGHRVLAIDWDLEAPGLHRYFAPFLSDSAGKEREGLIDFLLNYCDAASTPDSATKDDSDLAWMRSYEEIWRYAQPVNLPGIRCGGVLDFVTAGRQDDMYGTRVALFDWHHFYSELGGGAFLNRMRNACVSATPRENVRNDSLRSHRESLLSSPRYDFVLIDSRTGLSDTSGICTAQLPDTLVCLFTYNIQSIEGAARILQSAMRVRKELQSKRASHRQADSVGVTPADELQIIPVPSRAELGDTARLFRMREFAYPYFSEFLGGDPAMPGHQQLVEVELPYVLTLSYNEVLSVLDEASDSKSYLGIMHRLTKRLASDRGEVTEVCLDRQVANAIWTRYQEVLDSSLKEEIAVVKDIHAATGEDIDRLLQTILGAENDEGRTAIRRVVIALAAGEREGSNAGRETFTPFALSEFSQPERDAADRLARAGILCTKFDTLIEGRTVAPANDDLLRSSLLVQEWLTAFSTVIEWKTEIARSYARFVRGEMPFGDITQADYDADLRREERFWAELTAREQRISRILKQLKRTEIERADEERHHSTELSQLRSDHDVAMKQTVTEITELRALGEASHKRFRRAVVYAAAFVLSLVGLGASIYEKNQDRLTELQNQQASFVRELLQAQAEDQEKLRRNDESTKAWESTRYGKLTEAKASFSRLISKYPDDPGYRLGRAYAQFRIQTARGTKAEASGWKEAADDMQAAIALQLNNHEIVDPSNYMQLATWRDNAKDYAGASEAYKDFIKVAKDSDSATVAAQAKQAEERLASLQKINSTNTSSSRTPEIAVGKR